LKFSIKSFAERKPFFLIAGPCVIETEELTMTIAERVKEISAELDLPAVFKASFDKANRTSGTGFRGPGLETGLKILEKVKKNTGLPILTDVHSPEQAVETAEICEIIQIPAFLCRQTDLIHAAAKSCPVVNIKKGQFLSPWDTRHIVEKVRAVSKSEIILTERGTSFGYGNLVVDMRSFPIMKTWADAVVFDATHSLQLPGAAGDRTGGQREYIPHLAKAAMATGSVDGIFLEVHPEPAKSPSDSENILPLDKLEALLKQLVMIKNAVS